MNAIHDAAPKRRTTAQHAQRGAEIIVAAALLVLVAPVLLVCAVAVRRHDGGPVLVRELRRHRDGSTGRGLRFRCTTLRTEHGGPVQVTPPGAWMRRWSLDELPYLFDVVTGGSSRRD